MKTMNRKCGIAALTATVAMMFGKSAIGQTPDLSRAFSGETAAIAKPAAALQEKMKAEKSGFAASVTGKTHFEKLKGLYAQGYRPKRGEFEGFFFSGVCYKRSAPNVPAAAALKIWVRPNENGPLFPSAPYWEGFLSIHSDDINNGKVLDSGISAGDVIRDGNYEAKIRKSGAYLLAEISRLKTDNVYRAGDISAECYFFKKD